MAEMDPHEVLGVSPGATPDQIRKRYRELVRHCHPDVNPGDARAELNFRIIHAAYRTLIERAERAEQAARSADSRAAHHGAASARAGSPSASEAGATPSPWGGGFEPSDGRSAASAPSSANASGLEDLSAGSGSFETPGASGAFGSPGAFGASGVRAEGAMSTPGAAAPDEDASPEPARPMATPPRTVRLTAVLVDVELTQVLRPGIIHARIPGYGPGAINVPAGADTGTLARALVKTADGQRRIGVELRVRPLRGYQRRGLDLLTRYPMSMQAAYAGATVMLDAPTGRVRVAIPVYSRWGDTVRIVGRGVVGPDHRGDLYVEIAKP